MLQVEEPTRKIIININYFEGLPSDNYVAWIEGEEYKGIVCAADTVGDVIKEIGISVHVIELYRKNMKDVK